MSAHSTRPPSSIRGNTPIRAWMRSLNACKILPAQATNSSARAQIRLRASGRAASELSSQDGAAVLWPPPAMASRPAIPHFTEPWYCCAEPTRDQFVSIARASQPLAQPDAFL